MKISSTILVLLIVICPACHNTAPKAKSLRQPTVQHDSALDELKVESKQTAFEQDIIKDSLRVSNALDAALLVGKAKWSTRAFSREFNLGSESEPAIHVKMRQGRLFSANNIYLIIHRITNQYIYIDIFLKDDTSYRSVLMHRQWKMEYVNDTIWDINGDAKSDFVVNWYGTSGCCLKGYSVVYLFRNVQDFSRPFEFINPTFSPKESVVRGLEYGHPGETGMYKYKWNRDCLDTLEYVSFEKDKNRMKTGYVIVSSAGTWKKKRATVRRLKSAPTEYKKITGYDWFRGMIK